MLTERQSGLSVVGSFVFLHEADLARSLLEAHGIEAWLLDEHQIRQRWHLAGALGGVKLAVAPENAYRARQLLAEDHSEVLEDIAEAALPPHAEECCPRCGSARLHVTESQRMPGPLQSLMSLAWLFTLGLFVPRRRIDVERRCTDCTHAWTRRETR